MSTNNFQQCFTVPEAADYLRISRALVYKLIAAKKLTPIKIGERTIFRGAELERFLDAQSKAA